MGFWGYSELNELIDAHPNVKKGILIDTNILVAATYELDRYNDVASIFIDELLSHKIPLYCNVNIKAEFLDIHRRIIASEAILGFEDTCEKSLLPPSLASDLSSYRRKWENQRRNKPEEPPLRLSDSEIKKFRLQMISIKGASGDLWTTLSSDQIDTKLETVWAYAENELGLNFLSLRKEDQERFLDRKPEWEGVLKLMSNPGLSSYDAMIVNMFLASKFEVIASSDSDIAIALQRSGLSNKHVIIPDELKQTWFGE